MSTGSFLPLPERAAPADLWTVSNWLPQRKQIINAVQLRIHEVIGATGDERENEPDYATTSMRQGLGLVVITALLAGVLPFFVNWLRATRAGAALPFVQLAQAVEEMRAGWSNLPLPFEIWRETAQTIAGLEPRAPGWLAAMLSAFGEWINWPLSWLTFWLVYGLGILLVAKMLGAQTTLQRFYAATSYAYAPLLLTGLSPIPCLGALALVMACLWALALYIHAVAVVTNLGVGKAALSVALPAVLACFGSAIAAFAISLTVLGLWV